MGSTRRRPKSVSSKAQTPSPYGFDNAKSEAAGPKPFLDPRLLGSGMVGFRLGSGRLYLGWQLPRLMLMMLGFFWCLLVRLMSRAAATAVPAVAASWAA